MFAVISMEFPKGILNSDCYAARMREYQMNFQVIVVERSESDTPNPRSTSMYYVTLT